MADPGLVEDGTSLALSRMTQREGQNTCHCGPCNEKNSSVCVCRDKSIRKDMSNNAVISNAEAKSENAELAAAKQIKSACA